MKRGRTILAKLLKDLQIHAAMTTRAAGAQDSGKTT
jgi:hypothetical protein